MLTSALQARNRTSMDLGRDTTSVEVLSYLMVFMLIFFSTGGYLRSLATANGADDTLNGQVYQVLVWIMALFVMRSQFSSILQMFWRLKSIAALALLAPISALWSQLPETSLRRGIFLILSTAFGFYLVRRFQPVQLAQIIVLGGVAMTILSIVISVALPQVGVDAAGSWQGPFIAKNACAQVVLFLLTAAATIRFPTRAMNAMRYLFFFLATFLIIMTKAKTSWILGPAFFVLMGMGFWLRRVKRRDATFVLFVLIVGLVCFGALIPYVLPVVLNLLGKDADMTGRLPLWQSAILSILKRPLLGYGYVAFWTGMQGESLNVFMGTHFLIYQAQNGILEVWLELGLVGVTLALATLVGAIRNALICFQYRHSSVVNWYVGLVALTVAYNFDEAFLATAHTIGWLFYVIACAGLQREADHIRGRSAKPWRQPTHARSIPLTPFRSPTCASKSQSGQKVPHAAHLSHS
jgi:exopolysaccharide production protein ExoQ